jgi:hypothetical protein
LVAGEEKELMGGSGGCGGEGGSHVVDCSEGYGVELAAWGKRFGSCGPDFYVGEVQGADYFAEEGGLFVLGFCQGNGEIGVKEGYG